MAKRKELKLDFAFTDIVKLMAEENEKATTILKDIMEDPFLGGPMALLNLDDMNIRGEQIVRAYEYCGSSLPSLLGCIQKRDAGMIAHLNKVFPEQKAVFSGGSYDRAP